MKAADALADWLSRRPAVDGEAVVGWRFEVVAGEGVRVGVRDSKLGGAYEGPGSSSRLGGSVELHWSDGRLTSVGLDRRALLDPRAEIGTWRAMAYAERGGQLPPLATPISVPSVQTADPAAVAATAEDPAVLLGLLDGLRSGVRARGIRRLDAVLRASRGRRAVRTSRGFAAAWEETTCGIDLWGDEVAQAGYGRRALPSAADLERLTGEVTELARVMRRQQALPSAARGVLFAPAVVEELLGRLLLPNLAGRAIRDGRSPVARADLEAGRWLIRADLDVLVDTTLPLELATAPCSPDGIPAGRVALIKGGRFVSPILDLATSHDFGLPPTPAPRGRPTILLSGQDSPCALGAALSELGDGVVVRDLPGLHTQSPRRSRYALVAPDAQVVERGVVGGRCAVRVAGNLLDHLGQPSTRLVRMSGDPGVGLLVLSGVEILPA